MSNVEQVAAIQAPEPGSEDPERRAVAAPCGDGGLPVASC